MRCEACGGKIRVMLNVQMSIPGEFVGHLTKAVLRRADVDIWGADWASMSITCTNPTCGIVKHTGRYARALTDGKEEAR